MRFPMLAPGLLLVVSGCGTVSVPTGMPPTSPRVLEASSGSVFARSVFTMIDTDGDGRLTYEEVLQAPWGEPDGGYAPGERESRAYRFISRNDRNGDGLLTFSEAQGALVALRVDRDEEARLRFEAIDANRDGRLSYAEVVEAPWAAPEGGYAAGEKEARAYQFIRRYDRDRDGYLVLDEVEAALVSA
ncbi:MAG: hypothetical protein VKP72_01220 [bacterium]|nr:hypothetical protein [bacterium]